MTEEITLEEKLREKLENGEITQEEFDEMIQRYKELDLLSSKVNKSQRIRKNYSFSGSKTIKGGEINSPLKVSGKLICESNLTCPSMKISGSCSIYGELTSVDATKISGKLNVDEDAKFGGVFKLSGKAKIGGNCYFTDTAKVSGKLHVDRDIVSGDYLKVSGKVFANSIRSSSNFKLSGIVNVKENLTANKFYTSGGRSYIGGSIIAQKVEIATNQRKQMIDEDLSEDEENVENVGDLAKFISNVITKVVPKAINKTLSGSFGVPGIFEIEENIEADIVDISYTDVHGDVIGEDVYIGPEVKVGGTIFYKNTISVPQDTNYNIKQIFE